MLQLEFWEMHENIILKDEIKKLKESNEKVRKSLFAKHGDLAKKYIDLCIRMEIIEQFICKGSVLNHQSSDL